MEPLFRAKDDAIIRAFLGGAFIFFVLFVTAAFFFTHGSYRQKLGTYVEQDVPFSHEHHAGRLGIDCKFCHTGAEKGPFAGIPPTETCMKCHREIWKDSPMLAPVRESFRTGKPLVWKRVHRLPDYVYFDHSVHVRQGVDCMVCHGDVAGMPLMRKVNTLYMTWCLDCHMQQANRYISAKAGTLYLATRLKQITNCSTCHR